MVTSLVLFCGIAFLYYGISLYQKLVENKNQKKAERKRLKKISTYTVGTLLLTVLALLMLCILLSVELAIYRFGNWNLWLVEQFLYRIIEISFSFLILVCLREIPLTDKILNRDVMNNPSERDYLLDPKENNN